MTAATTTTIPTSEYATVQWTASASTQSEVSTRRGSTQGLQQSADQQGDTTPISKPDAWYAILCCSDDVDALVAQARAQGADTQMLEQLRAQVKARLEQLRSDIGSLDNSEYIVLVWVLYLDERIMRLLPSATRHLWRPMQVDWIGSNNGGTEFYRILDRLVQEQSVSAMLLEVFYYCLNNGFVGRYVDNPDAIENYKQYLHSRIAPEHQDTDSAKENAGTSGSLPSQRSAAWYYGTTLVLIVLMAVVATMLSNVL